MARKNRPKAEREPDPELDISSLIDVSFLLLIYFLVTSTLQPKETDLGVKLPAESSVDTPIKLESLTSNISKDGEIKVKDEVVEASGSDKSVPSLLKKVQTYAEVCKATDNEPIVIVAADDESVQQRFVDVVNALAKADIHTVTLTGFRSES